MPSKFYAVSIGRNPGIYTNWNDARAQVNKFPGATYKSFPSEREAKSFMERTSRPTRKSQGSRTQEASSSHLTVLPVYGRFIIYTDGSSSLKERTAGYGIVGIDDDGSRIEISGPLPDKFEEQTNNQAELYAIFQSLVRFNDVEKPITIYTDSDYSIKCLTSYIHDWKKNNWKTSRGSDVANKVLIAAIDSMIEERAKTNPVEFEHVSAHVGIEYNEKADALANLGRVNREYIETSFSTK